MSWSLCFTLVGRLTDMVTGVDATAQETKSARGVSYAIIKSGCIKDTG